MQILVDADACPHQIQKTITSIARDHALQCLFVSSYAHFSYQDFQKIIFTWINLLKLWI